MSQARPQLRKRFLPDESGAGITAAGAIDLASSSVIGFSSEHPSHPIENLLDSHAGLGGTRWISGRADVAERIVIEFDQPQTISRLVYEVEERERERTQEIRVEASLDHGETYRQVLVQEYSFSPGGATFQREDLRLRLENVTHLRLHIVPNKQGFGPATLTSLRLFY